MNYIQYPSFVITIDGTARVRFDSNENFVNKLEAELEALQQPKTCATCINRYFERDGLLLIDNYCHLNEFPISEFLVVTDTSQRINDVRH